MYNGEQNSWSSRKTERAVFFLPQDTDGVASVEETEREE